LKTWKHQRKVPRKDIKRIFPKVRIDLKVEAEIDTRGATKAPAILHAPELLAMDREATLVTGQKTNLHEWSGIFRERDSTTSDPVG
jgi:hypothetical protein